MVDIRIERRSDFFMIVLKAVCPLPRAWPCKAGLFVIQAVFKRINSATSDSSPSAVSRVSVSVSVSVGDHSTPHCFFPGRADRIPVRVSRLPEIL